MGQTIVNNYETGKGLWAQIAPKEREPTCATEAAGGGVLDPTTQGSSFAQQTVAPLQAAQQTKPKPANVTSQYLHELAHSMNVQCSGLAAIGSAAVESLIGRGDGNLQQKQRGNPIGL